MRRLSFTPRLFCTALALACFASQATAQSEPAYEPIHEYHPTSIFALVGSPVGRLRSKTSLGPSGCTGFLISPTHLMTNEHCVGDRWWDRKTKTWLPREVISVVVEMGAVDPSDPKRIETFAVQLPPLEKNEALDYAILTVEGNPAETFGFLSISTAPPQTGMPLWIIGHPKLLVQQISRVRCRVIEHARPHADRLHHTCPTAGGNSGSPVFDASTSEVIALNNAHYSAENREVGLAVPFRLIAAQSPLLRSIIDSH